MFVKIREDQDGSVAIHLRYLGRGQGDLASMCWGPSESLPSAQLGSSAARSDGKCNHVLQSIAQAGVSIFQGWKPLRQQACTSLGESTE